MGSPPAGPGEDPSAPDAQAGAPVLDAPATGAPGEIAGADSATSEPIPVAVLTAPAGRTCASCASPLLGTQEWCTQCGAAVPAVASRPWWRSTAAIVGALVLLAAGAGVAAYAAFHKNAARHVTITRTVAAQVPPAAAPSGAGEPATPTKPAGQLPTPLKKSKLPKIPLKAVTPATKKPEPASTEPGATKKKTAKEEGGKGATGATGAEGSEPKAVLLDTNAASTYNPYNMPASYFGDPSLTIDGDPSTVWTAEVSPTKAPAMAEGVLLDVAAHEKLATLKLVSASVGMTVQVYGTTAATPPNSIVSEEWTPLSPPRVLRKATVKIKLRTQKSAMRYLALWISRAPASALGTPEAPAHVSVGELELFPAS